MVHFYNNVMIRAKKKGLNTNKAELFEIAQQLGCEIDNATSTQINEALEILSSLRMAVTTSNNEDVKPQSSGKTLSRKLYALNAYKQALASDDIVTGSSLVEYLKNKWQVFVTEKQIRNCFNHNGSSFRLKSLYAIKEIAEEIFLIVELLPRKKQKSKST